MKTIAKYWFLAGLNLFKKLGLSNIMNICGIFEMDNIKKGQPIIPNDTYKDSVFFLKRGSVKIVNTLNDTIKYVVKQGIISGDLALYDKEAAAYALEDCFMSFINSEAMESLMEKHKSLKNEILKIYGLRILILKRRFHDLVYKDSSTQIREFI